MADFKALAKDTVIYGLSSIVGRFLNYLLVPLYTYKISAESGGYGVVTNLYAYTALLLVLLTYGMETTFFRFANKEGEDPRRVFSTAMWSLLATSASFFALVLIFLKPISAAMGYGDHPSYIWTMALTVAIDAFQCILFSNLRYQKKAIKFASLKILFIILNIGINLLYFVVLPALYKGNPGLIGKIYDPTIGVGYVFYINLFCTALVTFFFAKELRYFKFGFDRALMKRMLAYSWPILILGLAGILNQTADKILYPIVCPGEEGKVQLGIYGAVVKIAMIMAMITQAFRYAYEPFVFGSAKDKDSKETYAKGMKYFIIFTLLAFLVVMGYLDILRYIIQPGYWEGLRVVPIVMAAEIMMGVYFNLSFWYKLTDRTIWGAIFSGIGCAVLIAINLIFIPKYGYMACAWGGFAGYGVSMLLSYFVGKKYYPVNYPLKDIFVYVLLAGLLYAGIILSGKYLSVIPRLAVNTLLILGFVAYILRKDLPLRSLPVIGKYFR
ncbi:MAG: lipopolysaccharide biosynthesis protein [Bacteroidales bacterium]|nr:lipopolysaccharide biosynthesis protein [Bacteroidales bacterium]